MSAPTRITYDELWAAYLRLCGWMVDAWAEWLAAEKEKI